MNDMDIIRKIEEQINTKLDGRYRFENEKIVMLDLGNNQLTSLPESLGNLTALRVLDLGNNQLTSLPESLGNLTALTSLDLSDNQLTSLPESLGNLTALKVLYVGKTVIDASPGLIYTLKDRGVEVEECGLNKATPTVWKGEKRRKQ
jgi:Leucine-rich repeat (LRR) protein